MKVYDLVKHTKPTIPNIIARNNPENQGYKETKVVNIIQNNTNKQGYNKETTTY